MHYLSSIYIINQPLHVSGMLLSIIRRYHCVCVCVYIYIYIYIHTQTIIGMCYMYVSGMLLPIITRYYCIYTVIQHAEVD
jgi:hypothetical protein